MSKESLFIILGNQLFPTTVLDECSPQKIFMAEDYGLCTHYKYHKIKLILFLAAMRDYKDALSAKKLDVTYYDSDHSLFTKSYEDKLKDHLAKNKSIKKIRCFEIEDVFFEDRIKDFCEQQGLELEFIISPLFYCSRDDFQDYLEDKKKPFMKSFYEEQRKKFSILVDEDLKPTGGQWSFDKDNRKKLAKDLVPPSLPRAKKSKHLKNVKETVDKYFSEHPGDVDDFWLPTTRSESLEWLDVFINERLTYFGNYQDAITTRSDFVYHSVISPMLNMGLLLPDEVVDAVLRAYAEHDLPMNSVEGFIRQVLGWREFVRGVYQNYHELEESKNFFNHKGRMKSCWYEGTTGIAVLDDAIKKAVKYSYSHHIERLMVLSNMMLLCELDPKQVHSWFMEMYADSSDWVMGPNVYGMGQFSDGGLFATKPYTCGSNYYLKMSGDYSKGDWCDTVDGLYWRFIDKNKKFYASNHRMGFMVKSLERMKPERKDKIFAAAQEFIEKTTIL